VQLLLLYESTAGHKNYLYLTGIQLITSGAKFVPLIFIMYIVSRLIST
jgi:hypothetical protein